MRATCRSGGQKLREVVRRDPAGDDAEAFVLERKGVHVGGDESNGGRALGSGESARRAQHRLGQIGGDDARREAREAERRVATAGGDVEDTGGTSSLTPLEQLFEIGT